MYKTVQKFTELRLSNARERASQYELSEPVTGLRLRVYPSGRKAFIWRYRDLAGTQRVVTLGPYPALTLAEARIKLAKLRQQAEGGTDPAEQVRHEREAKRTKFVKRAAAPTVADILAEYLARHVVQTSRAATEREFRRLTERELVPRLGRLKAAELTRTAVVGALDDAADKATPRIADHAAEVLRAAFRFAVKRGRLERNPCMELPRYAKHEPRERVLTPAEIRTLWETLDAPKGVSQPVALALKLLLTTGQRRGSLMASEWSEWSADRWEIPAEHFKGRRTHVVPLSGLAQGLRDELQAMTGGLPFLFPSPMAGRPVDANAASKALRRLGFQFRVHDLRRTGATLMAESGVPRFTIARVLGHADSSVTAVYDRHTYVEEMRQALEKLARHIEKILGTPGAGEVIRFRG